jgi:hypothetical protein
MAVAVAKGMAAAHRGKVRGYPIPRSDVSWVSRRLPQGIIKGIKGVLKDLRDEGEEGQQKKFLLPQHRAMSAKYVEAAKAFFNAKVRSAAASMFGVSSDFFSCTSSTLLLHSGTTLK